MSYDVYAVNPNNPELNHFSANNAGWSTLWNMISQLAPETVDNLVFYLPTQSDDDATPVQYDTYDYGPYFNDGQTLPEEQCRTLAQAIQKELDAGRGPQAVDEIAKTYFAQSYTPNEIQAANRWFEQAEPFLKRFIDFAANSGGIQIW